MGRYHNLILHDLQGGKRRGALWSAKVQPGSAQSSERARDQHVISQPTLL